MPSPGAGGSRALRAGRPGPSAKEEEGKREHKFPQCPAAGMGGCLRAAKGLSERGMPKPSSLVAQKDKLPLPGNWVELIDCVCVGGNSILLHGVT